MVHTIHISITPTSTSDFSSAIDRAPGARSKSDEKSEVLVGADREVMSTQHMLQTFSFSSEFALMWLQMVTPSLVGLGELKLGVSH